MKKVKTKKYGCPYHELNKATLNEECTVTGEETVGATLIFCDFDYMSCPHFKAKAAEELEKAMTASPVNGEKHNGIGENV